MNKSGSEQIICSTIYTSMVMDLTINMFVYLDLTKIDQWHINLAKVKIGKHIREHILEKVRLYLLRIWERKVINVTVTVELMK